MKPLRRLVGYYKSKKLMLSMNILVCGSRNIKDKDVIYECIENAIQEIDCDDMKLISGDANGVDKISQDWAKDNNVKIDIYQPNWNKYGKAAGPIRNSQMIKNADFVVAIWDEESSGTKDTIIKAKEHNITHIVFDKNGNIIDKGIQMSF